MKKMNFKNKSGLKILAFLALCILVFSCSDDTYEDSQNLNSTHELSIDDALLLTELTDEQNQEIEAKALETFSLERRNELTNNQNSPADAYRKTAENEIRKVEYKEGGTLEILPTGAFHFTPKNKREENFYALIRFRSEKNIREGNIKWKFYLYYGASYDELNKKLEAIERINGQYVIQLFQYHQKTNEFRPWYVKNTVLTGEYTQFFITQSIIGNWGIDAAQAQISAYSFTGCPVVLENTDTSFIGTMLVNSAGEVDFSFDFSIPTGTYNCENGDLNLPIPINVDSEHTGYFTQSFAHSQHPVAIFLSKLGIATIVDSESLNIYIEDSSDTQLDINLKFEPMTIEEYSKYSMKLSLREPLSIQYGILKATFETGTIIFKEID